jgi:hypothetical protein
MGWLDRVRYRIELARHCQLAWATAVIVLTNVALGVLQPFGPEHVYAAVVLIFALTLCYFKYWTR